MASKIMSTTLFLLFLVFSQVSSLKNPRFLKNRFPSHQSIEFSAEKTVKCGPGYYSSFGYCIQCSSLCKACRTGSEKCTKCYTGYQLSGDTCIPEKAEEDCTSDSYVHDESQNENGQGTCENDCNCDKSRRCSPEGECEECWVVAEEYPLYLTRDACPEDQG